MIAEFEEKSFEQHLNNELAARPNLLYPPGQVIESVLGIDVALYANNTYFWRLFPTNGLLKRIFPKRPGVIMDPRLWGELSNEVQYFPPMKFNVFIQHKRPEYCNSKRYGEWNSWGCCYYRYDLVSHQQTALECLANQVGEQGIVVYACPAFYSYEELWKQVRQRNLVKSSNFAPAAKLAGHKRYSFKCAGSNGVGHSDPRQIEGPSFDEALEKLATQSSELSNTEFLVRVGKMIDLSMKETAQSAIYSQIINELVPTNYQFNPAVTFLRADLFRLILGAQWFIGVSSGKATSD